ncbi:DUF6183 family protein [Streptomyces sp. Caat 7-52]|uniref:DUF6183 family protein n=1 Tax=Streptomyces sp. Caat 7-52 TaxID=2949637 RepID=UPI00203517AA|nr:DUF6183 family protein [Streptomyces sp. Caat 7-52]
MHARENPNRGPARHGRGSDTTTPPRLLHRVLTRHHRLFSRPAECVDSRPVTWDGAKGALALTAGRAFLRRLLALSGQVRYSGASEERLLASLIAEAQCLDDALYVLWHPDGEEHHELRACLFHELLLRGAEPGRLVPAAARRPDFRPGHWSGLPQVVPRCRWTACAAGPVTPAGRPSSPRRGPCGSGGGRARAPARAGADEDEGQQAGGSAGARGPRTGRHVPRAAGSGRDRGVSPDGAPSVMAGAWSPDAGRSPPGQWAARTFRVGLAGVLTGGRAVAG